MLLAASSLSHSRELSFEERVDSQRAIEQVYWRHRSWPEGSSTPKPRLHEVVPDTAIRSKVARYLDRSVALEAARKRPITTEELQAELARMARDTKDPAMLRELFDALGNELSRIRECLARPALALRPADVKVETSEGRSFDSLPALGGGSCQDDTWAPMRPGEDPQGYVSHTAVWIGSEMIVWGGRFPAFSLTNRGSIYDPVTDSWRRISELAAPSARHGHAAIWAGTEMIVWGGDAGTALVNTGGRYDPVTDTWRPIATGAFVPAARSSPSVVWTGTEMIVWAQNGTGARYDPSADSWTLLSLANAPPGRPGVTVVWTGEEMIVWGGGVSTGSRYDPAADAWTATATGAGVPSGNVGHSAIWSGSKMVVWGGTSGGLAQSDGGRYDPATNTWAPTSPWNAPARRSRHVGVWTGNEMIVWGGRDGSSQYLNTGALYDPVTDLWRPLPEFGFIPAPRADAVAVWTGTDVIVWGGSGSDPRSGGRFEPATAQWRPTANDPLLTSLLTPRGFWTGERMLLWNTSIGALYCADTCPSQAPSYGPTLVEAKQGESALLSWSTVPGATAYDLARGSLEALVSSEGDFATSTHACLADELAANAVADPDVPDDGDGYWYLVRAGNCRGAGTYNDGTVEQVRSRDPGMALGAEACP